MRTMQVLTPRMIQSMEILQLPLMAGRANRAGIAEQSRSGDQRGRRRAESAYRPTGTHGRTKDFSEDEARRWSSRKTDQRRGFRPPRRISEYLENEEFATNSSNRVSSRQLRRRARQKARRHEQHRRPRRDPPGTSAGPMGVYRMPARRSQGRRSHHQLHRCRGIFPHSDFETIIKESKHPRPEDLQEALGCFRRWSRPGRGAKPSQECLLSN
jgi:hypothetical protein